MASVTPANMTLVCVLAATGGVFTIFHAYKFDGCRCLVPTKKEWFRALLTWMAVMTSLGMFVWGAGYVYLKYSLGWTFVPGYGPMPYPAVLWPDHYIQLNKIFSSFCCLAFIAQISLSAEEGLYWFHLMRAISRPHSAASWLNSRFFIVWVVMTGATGTALFVVAWVRFVDLNTQLARMFVVAAGLELCVLLATSLVILKFPKFLREVRASGANPEVRSRLHFFHEANKVRYFMRFILTSILLVLGIDGCTDKRLINLNHIAADMLTQTAFISYFFAAAVSTLLYLPRNHYSPNGAQRVILGRAPMAHTPAHQASHALMSLLREGGQWDDEDDRRAGTTRAESHAFEEEGEWEHKLGYGRWDDQSADMSRKDREMGMPVNRPAEIDNFLSPMNVRLNNETLPDIIQIHVHQEEETRTD